MIPIYIGYDPAETVAYHVAAHSIITRASEPVSIAPVGNTTLPDYLWWRGRGPYDSTEFSNARFMVPRLAAYRGWAIFMDCDVLCLADIAQLWACRDEQYAVMVRKHEHRPGYGEKFLGAKQYQYHRKNWSSLMLLNCAHPDTRGLTADYVNHAPGLDLHGFAWTDAIGDLPAGWNTLVEHGQKPDGLPQLAHYTQGGPWHGYLNQPCAGAWIAEAVDLVAGLNPRAKAQAVTGVNSINLVVSYEQDETIQS